ncbi:MAG TPA: NAD-dependent epimerase/dehydratase family protein [Halanaerobiales bacterium]|nr:NAD-dependent epimerase/dehydratase family protein [Halanaerobiales bacterium]
MILVTGATGHLGNVLVRKLLKETKENIRVLVLPGEDYSILEDFDIEIIVGDICDLNSLLPVFEGVDLVYHLAGRVSIKDFDPALKAINLDGTKNVIKACLDNQVKRLLYVSTVHVFVPEVISEITEENPIVIQELRGEYSKTKAMATLEVMRASHWDLDAVIVYPSGIIGPYDYRISPMSRLIIDHIKGKFMCSVEGSYDFVDVRDVADGIIKAAQHGKKGEGYILSGKNISINEIFKIIDGLKKPFFKTFNLPLWMAKIGIPFSHTYNKIVGCENLLTRYALYTLNTHTKFSNKKAKVNLGFKPRPIKITLADTIEWLEEHGLIKEEVYR